MEKHLCPLTRLLLLVLLHVAPAVMAADPAGTIASLDGQVTAVTLAGESRQLFLNSVVLAGERVRTGSKAAVQIRFTDNTRFELGENAELDIGKYAYKAASPENIFNGKIVKGVFRFFTGLIAKARPQSMSVNFSVGTIGIRGTHVIGEVHPTSAKIILMEPEDASRPSAIQVSNQFGSVIIDKPEYGTEIPDANSPPSPPRRMRLRTINNLMRTIRSIQTGPRMNLPRPHLY